MGKTWGNLYYMKNIAFYRVSPYEINPFANFWKKSFNGIKRDFTENGWFVIGLFGLTYLTATWMDEQNYLINRKQPGQYDHEK